MNTLESIIDDETSSHETDDVIAPSPRWVDAEQVRTIGHQANALPMRYQTLHASEESMRNIATLVQSAALSVGLLLVEDENAAPLSEQEELLISSTIAASRKKPKK
ncbi:MAG TPA: hypothetical protein VHA78_05845 [Candidatus Peribacteraceae bacterium]|nr:hypothetical protein [Candidatus Peribacteraceae bacterium]